MAKIVRVGALDDDTLDIELSNGNVILLDMKHPSLNARLSRIRASDRLRFPKTDGNRVYWDEFEGISLAEIIAFIQE